MNKPKWQRARLLDWAAQGVHRVAWVRATIPTYGLTRKTDYRGIPADQFETVDYYLTNIVDGLGKPHALPVAKAELLPEFADDVSCISVKQWLKESEPEKSI